MQVPRVDGQRAMQVGERLARGHAQPQLPVGGATEAGVESAGAGESLSAHDDGPDEHRVAFGQAAEEGDALEDAEVGLLSPARELEKGVLASHFDPRAVAFRRIAHAGLGE